MTTCKVHNVRFYKPTPKAVYCMVLQPTLRKLALSRSDASIEIWNLTNSPFIERTISSTADNSTIEGLAWYQNRLFSVGLHGLLIEYDLFTLLKKNSCIITGGAAYCLDVYNETKQLAVGTEQGYLNIFNLNDEEVLFEKFLDKQEGKILCLKYDATGTLIVSGGIDAIRIWNVATGHAVHKMTTSRSALNKPTIVWCLAITNDLTIISGDSHGKLTFWDGKIGAQIESYQSHKADVLSVVLSGDQNSLYCAGVDPNIMHYVKVRVKDGNEKWVKSIQRKVHDHDVRCLLIYDNKVYSSGIDGYLACSYYPPKTLLKYPPILQNPCVSVSKNARYIMLRYADYIELWSFGTYTISLAENSSKSFPLEEEPKKLVVIQRSCKDEIGSIKLEGIMCCSISNNGKYVVYSTATVTKLFHFNHEENEKPKLHAIKLDNEYGPCVQVLFTPNCDQLILACCVGCIIIIDLQQNIATLSQIINLNSTLTDTVMLLNISPCGQYLIAADSQSNIAVWKYSNKWEFYCKLPKYEHSPTAIAVQPETLNLMIVYANRKVVEYSLVNRRFTEFSKSLDSESKQISHKLYTIRNVTCDPRNNNLVVFHDDTSITVIDKNKKLSSFKNPKEQRMNSTFSSSDEGNCSINVIKKYKHLVHLDYLSDDEMVAVEVSPLSLIENLPPCIQQSTFGLK